MKVFKFFPLLFLVLDACIDPLPVEIISKTGELVVNGSITNAPGPYQVQLAYSSNLDASLESAKPATNASVWIVRDDGESEFLSETQPGVYTTKQGGMQGEIGRSYHIQIITASGNEYFSDPQKLVSAGTIEKIYTEFEAAVLNGDDPTKPQDALTLLIDATGKENESKFFRWRWVGVYHGRTYPELRTKGVPGGATVPDPPLCSGWIVYGGELVRMGPCTCCSCWPYEFSSVALLSDTRFTNQYTFNQVTLAKIPIVPMRFHDKYYIEIQQLSLSEEAYDFWQLVKAQQEASGSLFQPAAVKVTGNIYAINSKENALGIFEVSAITTKSIFLTKDLLPYALPPIEQIAEDCTLVYPNGTNEKPIFW